MRSPEPSRPAGQSAQDSQRATAAQIGMLHLVTKLLDHWSSIFLLLVLKLVVTNHHQKHTFSADEFVNEYLSTGGNQGVAGNKNLALIKHQHAPRSFHMGALMSELREMDDSQKMAAKEQQFFKSNEMKNAAARPLGPAETWSDEYELTLDLSNQQPLASGLNRQLPYQRGTTADDSSLKWSIDYLNQNESKIYEENDV